MTKKSYSLNPRYVCDEANAVWNEPNDPNYKTEFMKVSQSLFIALIKDIVAQIACMSINAMAKTPVNAWMSMKFPLLVVVTNVVINVVPVVSKTKPAQKNVRCFGLRILASLSLQTPIE